MLADFLCMQGYTVATAGDGVAALEELQRERYDVVLSDLKMPRLGGLGLLSEVGKCSPGTRTILMTGFGTVESAVDAMKRGAQDYILKPFRVEQVAMVVRRALEAGAPSTITAPQADAQLEASFHASVDAMWMAYQPILTAADGSVFGVEALLRTDDRSLGGPSEILAAAEKLNRVHELGRLVRERVAEDAAHVPESALLFVNLHPADLLDPLLYSASAPLSQMAKRVVLEITERSSLQDVGDAVSRVASLRAMGFRIAIDDLGAGYAGLTSFAQLEPEIVKLDMTLVRNVHASATHRRVIRSMTALAREMNMLVVAEGIEVEEEREAVVALGCELLQGYLFARPARLRTSG